MASLALIVSLIFLSVLIIGPLSYLISCFSWMPKLIIWLLAALTIFIGLWALFIPVPLFRILGLIDLAIGLRILMTKPEKQTQA
jgi:hypothetical protein